MPFGRLIEDFLAGFFNVSMLSLKLFTTAGTIPIVSNH